MTLSIAGCGSSPSESKSGEGDGVRSVVIAYSLTTKPSTYQDESGNAAGFDIEVFQKIDELLEDYEFTFVGVDKDAVNVGVEAGSYEIGLAGYFKNPARLETYLMPEYPVGGSRVALVVKEDSTLNSFEELVATGGSIVPVASNGGIPGIIDTYNLEHPDAPITNFELASETDKAADVQAVAAGDYDAYIVLNYQYETMEDEIKTGTKLSDTCMVVPSFAIINKDEADLAAAIDGALAELSNNGFLSELSVKYYGEDVFTFFE